MEQKNINIVFRKKGKTCSCAKAAARLLKLNEPELTRFFSAGNQNKIILLLEQAKENMRRYHQVKAHDYVVEDFSDECASRLYLASELVCRPAEIELKNELAKLFALTPAHLKQIEEGPALWKSTYNHWVDYTEGCWSELFGHKTVF